MYVVCLSPFCAAVTEQLRLSIVEGAEKAEELSALWLLLNMGEKG